MKRLELKMTKSQNNSFELKFLSKDLNTAQSHFLCFDWFLLLVLVAEDILSTIIM